jgi:hypothetical protein
VTEFIQKGPRARRAPYCGAGMPLNQTSYAITITPTTPNQRRLSLKSIGPPPDAELSEPRHKGIRGTEAPTGRGQAGQGGLFTARTKGSKHFPNFTAASWPRQINAVRFGACQN